MRRMIDLRCSQCGEERLDQYVDVDTLDAHECGGKFERVTLAMPIAGRVAAVHGDDIPGGLEIRHGLCNPDGTPRKYYSRTEINNEAKRRGLVNHVQHIADKGSDKNKHTQRWV